MWDVRDVRDVGDVGCAGCGMFGMWDVGDVGCLGCGMWDVGCLLGSGMLIYKMPCNIRSLLIAEVPRRKKITHYSLRNSLVTCCEKSFVTC